MKKLIFTLTLLLSICCLAQAQNTLYGIKAGANYATIDGDDVEENEYIWGFNAGAFLSAPITEDVFIQPELLFSLKGTGDPGTEDDNLSTMYIEIPVMAKVMLGEFFNVQFGPYAGFLINSKRGRDDINDLVNVIDAGLGVGLGAHLSNRLSLDARYLYGLTNVYDDDFFAGHEIDANNRLIQVSLGYRISGD